MSRTIDLNADLGEDPSAGGRRRDAAILEVVTSCSIACGGHAGDAETMRATLQLANACGVAAGAHPSYPDREGFGRRALEISIEDLRASLDEQIAALAAEAAALGVALSHVKPHGALYNAAAKDLALAEAVAAEAGGRPLVGPPNSALEAAAKAEGLAFIAEGFVDRAYAADGALVDRGEPGAVIPDLKGRLAQAQSIAVKGAVATVDGGAIPLQAATLCLHSDTDGAVETARFVRRALEDRRVEIRRPEL